MNRKRTDSSRLEGLYGLTNQQLDEMLSIELTRSEKDEELIIQIVNILEQRHAVNIDDVNPKVFELWEQFLAETAPKHPVRKVNKRKYWGIGIAAAAAILCLIIVAVPAITAGASTVSEIFGWWTEDVFTFLNPTNAVVPVKASYDFQSENSDLEQLQEAVESLGITEQIVPQWLPEGFELTELKVISAPDTRICAVYKYEDDCIIITFELISDDAPNILSKDNLDATAYEVGGIKHYLMQNNDRWTVAWVEGSLECSIATSLKETVLRQIVDSIYYGG